MTADRPERPAAGARIPCRGGERIWVQRHSFGVAQIMDRKPSLAKALPKFMTKKQKPRVSVNQRGVFVMERATPIILSVAGLR